MHLELEDALAKFLRKEGVVTFSTGYTSNLGIIAALVSKNDYVICARENHASIYDGCKLSYGKMLRYRHSDMASLERRLQEVPENCGALIVTDGVFSMSGDIAKLPEICALAQKYGARVMVDDARLGYHRRGRSRHGKLLRLGGSSRYLHGHILKIFGISGRLYSGRCPYLQLCPARSKSTYFHRFHSACLLCGRTGSSAPFGDASGAGRSSDCPVGLRQRTLSGV